MGISRAGWAGNQTRPISRPPPARQIGLLADEWPGAWRRLLCTAPSHCSFDPAAGTCSRPIPNCRPRPFGRCIDARIPGSTPRKQAPRGRKSVPAVFLGNLYRQRGPLCWSPLAERSRGSGQGRGFVLIGNIRRRLFAARPRSSCTAAMRKSDIAHLAERYGVTAWLCNGLARDILLRDARGAGDGLPVYGLVLRRPGRGAAFSWGAERRCHSLRSEMPTWHGDQTPHSWMALGRGVRGIRRRPARLMAGDHRTGAPRRNAGGIDVGALRVTPVRRLTPVVAYCSIAKESRPVPGHGTRRSFRSACLP